MCTNKKAHTATCTVWWYIRTKQPLLRQQCTIEYTYKVHAYIQYSASCTIPGNVIYCWSGDLWPIRCMENCTSSSATSYCSIVNNWVTVHLMNMCQRQRQALMPGAQPPTWRGWAGSRHPQTAWRQSSPASTRGSSSGCKGAQACRQSGSAITGNSSHMAPPSSSGMPGGNMCNRSAKAPGEMTV